MALDEKKSQYVITPYVFDDFSGESGAGQFIIERQRTLIFWNTYYKTYVSGINEGKSYEISRAQFKYWRNVGEDTYGYLDFKGDFVPGSVRRSLPVAPVEKPIDRMWANQS